MTLSELVKFSDLSISFYKETIKCGLVVAERAKDMCLLEEKGGGDIREVKRWVTPFI